MRTFFELCLIVVIVVLAASCFKKGVLTQSFPPSSVTPSSSSADELAKARELAIRLGMPESRATDASMLDMLSEISIAFNNAETVPVLTSEEMTQITERLNLDEDAPIVEKIKAQNQLIGKGQLVVLPNKE